MKISASELLWCLHMLDYSGAKCTFHWYWDTEILVCARTELALAPLGFLYPLGRLSSPPQHPLTPGTLQGTPGNLPGSPGNQDLALRLESMGRFRTCKIFTGRKSRSTRDWLNAVCFFFFINLFLWLACFCIEMQLPRRWSGRPGQTQKHPLPPLPAFVLRPRGCVLCCHAASSQQYTCSVLSLYLHRFC